MGSTYTIKYFISKHTFSKIFLLIFIDVQPFPFSKYMVIFLISRFQLTKNRNFQNGLGKIYVDILILLYFNVGFFFRLVPPPVITFTGYLRHDIKKWHWNSSRREPPKGFIITFMIVYNWCCHGNRY